MEGHSDLLFESKNLNAKNDTFMSYADALMQVFKTFCDFSLFVYNGNICIKIGN